MNNFFKTLDILFQNLVSWLRWLHLKGCPYLFWLKSYFIELVHPELAQWRESKTVFWLNSKVVSLAKDNFCRFCGRIISGFQICIAWMNMSKSSEFFVFSVFEVSLNSPISTPWLGNRDKSTWKQLILELYSFDCQRLKFIFYIVDY